MKPKEKDYTALLKPVGTKQTAVEFLLSVAVGENVFDDLEIKQAKEMERQQKDDFAIEFYDWCNSIEGKYLIDDLKIVGELNKNPTTNELLKIFKNK
jgi:hypothetical protein